MILVDSSVWIDYFTNRDTPETDKLDSLLGKVPIAIGDLILAEVLQGFRKDEDFNHARELFSSLALFSMVGPELALKSAMNFRLLRKKGITVRKTVDTIIATYCIESQLSLLASDRDFLPFHEHLGLEMLGDLGERDQGRHP